MSILNPTPQEIEDDKIRTYRDYWNTTKAEEQPAKTKLDDIVEKHIAEAMSTVMQEQIEAEKYSTKQHSGKIFIVAGTRAEYTAWVDRNGYKYTETQYVQNAQSLKGLENIRGFYIGTYDKRPDIQDIMSVIATSKRLQTIITTGLSEHTYGGTIGIGTSVGSVAAISYEQIRVVAEIREKLHDAFEATTYPDATIKFIISVIDKELDKF